MKNLVFKIIPLIIFLNLIISDCEMVRAALAELDQIANEYLKLALEIHSYKEDEGIVDDYHGPNENLPQQEILKGAYPFEMLKERGDSLNAQLDNVDFATLSKDDKLRLDMLKKQVNALRVKLNMLSGNYLSFDDESFNLYDVVPPAYPEEYFKGLIDKLNNLIPGEGDLYTRYQDYIKQFVIPKNKLEIVFKTAIKEARNRTLKHIKLPENENFELQFVTGKSWSAYNFYKGNGKSIIQINTDLPITIDSAIDLASHEGYPGHHVFNTLVEQNLVNRKQWVEFSLNLLFSPQSLISEGTANYGVSVAFPGREKLDFEKLELYPLAGLDPDKAENYEQVLKILERLNYVNNFIAKRFLDESTTPTQEEKSKELFQKYLLHNPERAEKRLSFIKQYRSYVINYNLGQDIVAKYVEMKGGTNDQQDKKWEIYRELLTNPKPASLLLEELNLSVEDLIQHN